MVTSSQGKDTGAGSIKGYTVQQRLAWARRTRFGPRGQAAFARALGIAPTTYAHYEKDTDPPIDVLIRMASASRINPRWLLHGSGAPFLAGDARIPSGEDAASAITDLLEELERLGSQVRESAVAYRPDSGEIDWPGWLMRHGYPQSEVIRVEDDFAWAGIPRGSLAGVDRSANTPEDYRGVTDLPVVVEEEDGPISFQLLTETDGKYVLLSGEGESGTAPRVRLLPPGGRFPIVGRVVFIFKQYAGEGNPGSVESKTS